MKDEYRVVIGGGGIAGVSAARKIAASGENPQTLLVCEEDRLPYKRTKVSKNIAFGFDRDAFALESWDWYNENGIDIAIGERVAGIDPSKRQISLAGGESTSYGTLILATGGLAKRPPEMVPSHHRVHTVRTAADVERLIAGVADACRVLVIGTGVLGVEVAEQLAKRDASVVLAGRTDRLMPRELNPAAANRLAALFETHGVELRLNTGCDPVTPSDHEVQARVGGRTEQFDAVVYCIGISPDVALAESAGLEVRTGVLVNDYLETSTPGIYACGDVAEHYDGYATHLWHAAELQGEVAAENALGGHRQYERPNFRLKCEVFDDYFFSAGYPGESDAADYEIAEHTAGNVYRAEYYRQGALAGLVMAGDKENAKRYQKAVREGWSRQAVAEEFG